MAESTKSEQQYSIGNINHILENEIEKVGREQIGHGASGCVWHAHYIGSLPSVPHDIAVKYVKKTDEHILRREVEALYRYHHPNIIELFGSGHGTDGKIDDFIVMEYMENVLHFEKVEISREQLTNWTMQLATGIAFLHEKNFVHRDLKPSNILLTKDKTILKISDFDHGRQMSLGMTTNTGTTVYMAPEVLKSGSNYEAKCDVYSFGIILCEMFTRQKPYAQYRSDFVNEICKIDSTLRPDLTVDVPKALSLLIQQCWMTFADDRPTMDEILRRLKTETIFDVTKEDVVENRLGLLHTTLERDERLKSLKVTIEANQLTSDFGDKFMIEMGNLKTEEIKEIGMMISNKILDAKGDDQKIRCKQTLAFIVRLAICNESIWIHYYRETIFWCYEKIRDHLDITEQEKIWMQAKERYIRIMNFQFWKQKNHPDRMMILSNFSSLCYSYYSTIDKDSIDLLKKWIDEAKLMEKGELNDSEWSKSITEIERGVLELEIWQLWREWGPKDGDVKKRRYCEKQMENLQEAIITGNVLNTKVMRMILQSFRIRLDEYSSDEKKKNEICIDMLNRLDPIKFGKEEIWICNYHVIIQTCYLTLAEITTNTKKRQKIAKRMQMKYRQLIKKFENENNSLRVDIINSFSNLFLNQYKNEIDTEYISYLRSIMTNARSQEKGILTDFEFELNQFWLERTENQFLIYNTQNN